MKRKLIPYVGQVLPPEQRKRAARPRRASPAAKVVQAISGLSPRRKVFLLERLAWEARHALSERETF